MKIAERTDRTVQLQRQVMDQMECYRRYPMTGPVALDLHFVRAARRNPPTIQRLAWSWSWTTAAPRRRSPPRTGSVFTC